MTDSNRFLGVLTPQANPTVEVEFREFLRGRNVAVTARLVSTSPSPADRLREYLQQLPTVVDRFDELELAAIAFACTGSSYLLGSEEEARIVHAVEAKRGCPVVTATQAIQAELELRRARRIAIFAPYPRDLCDAAVGYWRRQGFEIVACERMDLGPDTRSIYALTEREVADAVHGFDPSDADVVLLSGTGMPTISVLEAATRPTISSNLCLAAEVLRQVGALDEEAFADVHILRGQR